MIALVVARAKNGVIGQDNDLPWHLPADLKHFKDITAGHTVIMGRKTFESIYKRLNGPLPGRRNLVVSRTQTELPEGFEVYNTLETALEAASAEKTFIIGRTTLFKECLNKQLADEIYLTEIEADVAGDAFFPAIDSNEWTEVSREHHTADPKNAYAYSFVHLRRKS